MRITRVCVGPLETNCWVVRLGDNVVVIDPGDEPDAILSAVGDGDVLAILLTHCHFDHIGAVAALVESTDAPVLVHVEDAECIQTPEGTGGFLFGMDVVSPPPDRTLTHGEMVTLGTLTFEVISTPGHTPGSICLLARDPETGVNHLFSGDTLFAGSIGRTDFPRGDSAAIIRSLAQHLSVLPSDTVVHPGHGPETTLGRESRINPFWPRA